MFNNHRLIQANSRGFTLTEVMIASTVALVAFGLASTALMGFRNSAVSTYAQIQVRHNHQKAIDELGRLVMHASLVEVEEGDTSQVVRIWHDEQDVWTPSDVGDDTEGVLYLCPETNNLFYQPDIMDTADNRVLAEGLQSVEFEMVGQSLFVRMQYTYGGPTEGYEREMVASFATRNNPKLRIGASQ